MTTNQKYVTHRNMHKNVMKFGPVVLEICEWADRQTNIFITALYTPPRGIIIQSSWR